MSKNVSPIILKNPDTHEEFVLEFNAESVKFAEQRGFALDDCDRAPLTKIPELFYYAFRMHHRRMSKAETDRIYFNDLGGLQRDVFRRLVELYSLPYECLFRDDDDGEDENRPIKFTVTM